MYDCSGFGERPSRSWCQRMSFIIGTREGAGADNEDDDDGEDEEEEED